MGLPIGFDQRPITQRNVTMLHCALGWDEEFCPEPEVWRHLFQDEGMPLTMGSVLAWIEPPP